MTTIKPKQELPGKDKISKWTSEFHDSDRGPKDALTVLLSKLPSQHSLMPTQKESYLYDSIAVVSRISGYFDSVGMSDMQRFIPIKTQIILYNIATKFSDFEGQTELKTMRAGFGGSGGQIQPYAKIGDKQAFLNNTIGCGYSKEWSLCSDDWFAFSFCTFDQWEVICLSDMWS